MANVWCVLIAKLFNMSHKIWRWHIKLQQKRPRTLKFGMASSQDSAMSRDYYTRQDISEWDLITTSWLRLFEAMKRNTWQFCCIICNSWRTILMPVRGALEIRHSDADMSVYVSQESNALKMFLFMSFFFKKKQQKVVSIILNGYIYICINIAFSLRKYAGLLRNCLEWNNFYPKKNKILATLLVPPCRLKSTCNEHGYFSECGTTV